MRVFTVGHSTRPVEELVALLKSGGIDLLVDVRSVPRSRTNPQFNAEVLPRALEKGGIGYRHLAALGGLRRRPRGAGPSPNTLWRSPGFRNYADYAMTPEFRAGLAELMALGREHSVAIMCAETLWWRCHRRIISDHLIARGVEVQHILGPGKVEAGRLTPGAEIRPGGSLTYPAAQGTLL